MVVSKKHFPPGTLVYTGNYKDEPFEIEIYSYNEADYTLSQSNEFGEVIPLLERDDTFKWVNVIGLSHVNGLDQIAKYFAVDNLVMEDVVHVSQRSKVEHHEDYLFGIFKMSYVGSDDEIYHEHVSMLLKESVVVTFQERHEDVFGEIRSRIKENRGQIRKRNSEYLFYALLDAIVDHQLEVMNFIKVEVDDLERAIIDEDDSQVENLYDMRKELLVLKNAVIPMEEILESLLSDRNVRFSADTKRYLRDIEDHVSHLKDSVLLYREIVLTLFETHQTNVSNHMNKVMTTLTIFSAMFIPLSFLAGVFGMNFKYMPGLEMTNAFVYFTGFCVMMVVSMLIFFKKNNWF